MNQAEVIIKKDVDVEELLEMLERMGLLKVEGTTNKTIHLLIPTITLRKAIDIANKAEQFHFTECAWSSQ